MNRLRAAALMLVSGLVLTGCLTPEDDDGGDPFNAVVTIPAVAPARAAAVRAVCGLPGVQRVSTAYYEQSAVVDMWVYYRPVPDRWPFDEKVVLAVSSAVKPYAAAGSRATLRVRIVQPRTSSGPGQASATKPSSAFEASASCDGKIRTV